METGAAVATEFDTGSVGGMLASGVTTGEIVDIEEPPDVGEESGIGAGSAEGVATGEAGITVASKDIELEADIDDRLGENRGAQQRSSL